ncbi:hypothetical protein GQ53DRAFT_351056 [Thozetella sp. PMI_491]|nr:hypothetical protein GQ53DRAFT_351056 [Thozetella sp. PMI_491]
MNSERPSRFGQSRRWIPFSNLKRHRWLVQCMPLPRIWTSQRWATGWFVFCVIARPMTTDRCDATPPAPRARTRRSTIGIRHESRVPRDSEHGP